MNYKRLVSIILCFVILFCFGACQAQTSGDDAICWMPFGLKFGMTYDEFSKQLNDQGIEAPALVPADSNVGYVTDGGIYLDIANSTVWEFLDSATMKKLAGEDIDVMDDPDLFFVESDYDFSSPVVYFSFNQDQELYEFYCFWTCFSDRFPSSVMPEIINNYNNKLGIEGSTSDYSGEWNTDEHRVAITYSESEARMVLIHHCLKYNLDS